VPLAPSASTRSAARALEYSADEPTRAAVARRGPRLDAPRSAPLYFGGNVDRSLAVKTERTRLIRFPYGERKQPQKIQKILPGRVEQSQ